MSPIETCHLVLEEKVNAFFASTQKPIYILAFPVVFIEQATALREKELASKQTAPQKKN